MCFRPTREEMEEARAREEALKQREAGSPPTWMNTSPRGNPEPDEEEVQREREKLTAIVAQ